MPRSAAPTAPHPTTPPMPSAPIGDPDPLQPVPEPVPTEPETQPGYQQLPPPLPPLVPARWTPTDYPTPLLIDLFPANVTLPAGATEDNPHHTQDITAARIIITADPSSASAPAAPGAATASSAGGSVSEPLHPNRVYVFVDSTIGPALLYTAPTAQYPERTGNNREGTIQIQTSSAPETQPSLLTFTKAGGCGCGSALKSFAPFTHPYSVA